MQVNTVFFSLHACAQQANLSTNSLSPPVCLSLALHVINYRGHAINDTAIAQEHLLPLSRRDIGGGGGTRQGARGSKDDT